MLGIEGHIQTRTYDAQDGSKRYVTEIMVDGFDFLEAKKIVLLLKELLKQKTTTISLVL